MNSRQGLWNLAYLIAAISGLLLLQSVWREARLTEIVPYSEFERALEAGRIERVADDLAKATAIARAIVTRYGMHQKLGLVAYEEEQHAFLPGLAAPVMERRYSEATAREIDCAVREAVQNAFETSTHVLGNARRVLERGAKLLLSKETLAEAELAALKSELLAAQSRQATAAVQIAAHEPAVRA